METGAPVPVSARPPAPARRPRWLLATLLFATTLVTTTVLGTGYYLGSRTDVVSALPLWLHPEAVRTVLGRADLLGIGLRFSLPALFVLLCHELGHYLACRWYHLPATLPYFLPAPVGIGTFGAFIRIRAPLRGKRELFDVAVAGPLAGFAALLPILAYGIARSTPVPLERLPDLATSPAYLVLPGQSLLQHLLVWLFHGPLPAGWILDLHPFALAGWIGLFATMLNLIPLGQLDGGHLLYAVAGRRQRQAAIVLWLLLLLAGIHWPGWLFWCAVTLIMGLRHPPVVDEATPLDTPRRRLAFVTLAIFLLSFMPVPIEIVPIAF